MFDLHQATEILRRTPSTVDALLRGLDDSWIRENEGPETFSAFDVIGHLIDGEETDWMVRARIILEHGESRPFDRYDRFRHWTRNKGKPMSNLLDEFEYLRAQNLRELKRLGLSNEKLALT